MGAFFFCGREHSTALVSVAAGVVKTERWEKKEKQNPSSASSYVKVVPGTELRGESPGCWLGCREKGEREKAEKQSRGTARHCRHTGRRSLHRGQQLSGALGSPELAGKDALCVQEVVDGAGRQLLINYREDYQRELPSLLLSS